MLGYEAPSRARKEIREGDVLVSTVRPNLNTVAMVPPELDGQIASTGFCVLRPDLSVIDGKYLFYFSTTQDFINILTKKARGAHYPAVSDGDIKGLDLPLPTLSEQKRIVEILDQADALRRKRAEADKIAERIIPALFYKMFGDPARFDRSSTISDLVEKTTTIDPRNKPDDDFTYIDISSIDGGCGTIVSTKRILGSEAPTRARKVVRDKDVVVSTVRPYLRATALVPDDLHNQVCSTGFCILRSKDQRGYGFLYAYSRLHWFAKKLSAVSRGASYPAVSDSDILSLPIPEMTTQALDIFDEQVLSILELTRHNNSAKEKLDKLFTQILHSSFSGNLTAKWREVHMAKQLTEDEGLKKAIIKVIGIGGAGGNAIDRMINSGLGGVEFIAMDTDSKDLENNKANTKIQIGENITRDPFSITNMDIVTTAMETEKDAVSSIIKGADMIFVIAGMGGGTGTAAAPIVAQMAMGLLKNPMTVGIVTRPFDFEGAKQMNQANSGIEEMQKFFDTVISIPNQKLLSLVDKSTTVAEAFQFSDNVLYQAVRGISDLMTEQGLINLDFADLHSIMPYNKGDAIMSTGVAKGEKRVMMAVHQALSSPLLEDVNIRDAQDILVNVTGDVDLDLKEVDDATSIIFDEAGEDANIIFGGVVDPSLSKEIRVTVFAMGFDAQTQADKVSQGPTLRDEKEHSHDIPIIPTHQSKKEDNRPIINLQPPD
tara:strand:- start:783 stop:2927 length:2145 start_codon:yes stop_codon:yes gene_type:complete